MKKKILRTLCSLALTVALLAGMCVNAFAFQYPSAYWKLHDAWSAAVSAENVDQVLSLAQQTYDLLTPYGLCADVCYNLEPKCARASWCAEMKGDIPLAIKWLERQRTFAQWLDKNECSYRDTLLNIDARMEYLNAAASPEIYILTDQNGPSYSGSGAPASGTLYGSTAGGSRSGESAALMYVTFGDSYSVEYWINYNKNTYPKFRQATEGGVIELAWNFSPESTAGAQAVLSADSYISESLAAMGRLNATVLLRVGAEMNNWASCDSAAFIQAFQKIAREARKYDNIKMVFSPDNISNRNVNFADFYPGDAYVDWIGVSTYHNTNFSGECPAYTFGAAAYGNDAYYGKGLYDSDPLVILRPLVRFAEKHGKPMMISECGFAYRNNKTGSDQTNFAVDQLNKFYSYVNMIYPQVKAVFYFDNTLNGAAYSYALAGSSTVAAAYQNAIANNGAYLAQDQTEGKTWKELDQAGDVKGALKLAVYVSFPGSAAATVKYYVDGAQMTVSTQAPYYFELNTAALTPGRHTVKAVASSGQFKSSTQVYEINVNDGRIDFSSASSWAQSLLSQAKDKGLITERTSANFQSQITRLQFAELAVNLIEQVTGKEVPVSGQTFTDTSDPVVRKAVAAGVTAGKGDGKFAPDDKITRQEICVMLNAVIRYVDGARGTSTLTNTSIQMDSRFTDTASIANWAVDSVALLTNNGLMSGKDGGRVAPLDNTKIEEAVVLILALYNHF